MGARQANPIQPYQPNPALVNYMDSHEQQDPCLQLKTYSFVEILNICFCEEYLSLAGFMAGIKRIQLHFIDVSSMGGNTWNIVQNYRLQRSSAANVNEIYMSIKKYTFVEKGGKGGNCTSQQVLYQCGIQQLGNVKGNFACFQRLHGPIGIPVYPYSVRSWINSFARLALFYSTMKGVWAPLLPY